MTPFSLLVMPDFTDPSMWLSLLTLTFLEIVLGVDNVIFISIVANKLPVHQQAQARNWGLSLALFFRLLLLFAITWIVSLTEPVFILPFGGEESTSLPISWRDIILIVGGLFLIYKSTVELHNKMESRHSTSNTVGKTTLTLVLTQIILVDMVFSFDSILTAIGLVDNVSVMVIAVIVSMGVMLAFAGQIGAFVNRHPTMQVLALTFLVLIGFMLILEGLHQHVPKAYIYAAIGYALAVEFINMRIRKSKEPLQLHGVLEDAVEKGMVEKP
jgi:predicted tellurium resistance membrane protein TerC